MTWLERQFAVLCRGEHGLMRGIDFLRRYEGKAVSSKWKEMEYIRGKQGGSTVTVRILCGLCQRKPHQNLTPLDMPQFNA